MFIIREVNSDMPSKYRTNAGKKIICPDRDSNPRQPDLMKGVLSSELPRQSQWSESNISYTGNIDYFSISRREIVTRLQSRQTIDTLSRTYQLTQDLNSYSCQKLKNTYYAGRPYLFLQCAIEPRPQATDLNNPRPTRGASVLNYITNYTVKKHQPLEILHSLL